jgi:hypothetical protein
MPEPDGFASKFERGLAEAADVTIRYFRTLAESIVPFRFTLRRRAWLSPNVYFAVSAFAAVVVFYLWNGHIHEGGLVEALRHEVADVSTAGLIIRTLPAVVTVLILGKLVGRVLRVGSTKPEGDTEALQYLPAYIGGTQLALFSLVWITTAAFNAAHVYTGMYDSLSFFAALLGVPVLSAAIAIRTAREECSGRRPIVFLILLVFILVDPIIVFQIAVAPNKLQKIEARSEEDAAFRRPLRATVVTASLTSGRQVEYFIWLRNDSSATVVLHNNAGLVWGPFAAFGDRRLKIVRWSGGERPIVVLRPNEIGWAELQTIARVPLLPTHARVKSTFRTTFVADYLARSGTLHGEAATDRTCVFVNFDGTITPCQDYDDTWKYDL